MQENKNVMLYILLSLLYKVNSHKLKYLIINISSFEDKK